MRFAEFMNSAKLPESVMELSKSIDKALNSLVDGVLNGETPKEIERNTTTAKMAIVEASEATYNCIGVDAFESQLRAVGKRFRGFAPEIHVVSGYKTIHVVDTYSVEETIQK